MKCMAERLLGYSVCRGSVLLGYNDKNNNYNNYCDYYAYLLYYVCIAVFTLHAGLLPRSQYSEGPVTGHLDTGFSWFSCA